MRNHTGPDKQNMRLTILTAPNPKSNNHSPESHSAPTRDAFPLAIVSENATSHRSPKGIPQANMVDKRYRRAIFVLIGVL